MGLLPTALLVHLRAPHGYGEPWPGGWVGRAENAACGDRLELGLVLQGERVIRAGFRASGCSALLAVASAACAAIEGCDLEQADQVDVARLVERAGGVGPTQRHAVEVVARAAAAALALAREHCHPDS